MPALDTAELRERLGWMGFDSSSFQKQNAANAELITALRNNARALLTALDEAEKRVKELEAALRETVAYPTPAGAIHRAFALLDRARAEQTEG